MKRPYVVAGLALAIGCLAVWATGVVVGQPTLPGQPALPPPNSFAPVVRPVEGPAPRAVRIPGQPPVAPVAQVQGFPGQLPPPVQRPMLTIPPTFDPATTAPQPVMLEPAPAIGAQPVPVVGGGMAPGAPHPLEENPTGRQEPSVSIEWIGPPTIKVGQPALFQIVVKNVCGTPVHQTVVRCQPPAGVTIASTEPRAVPEGELMAWDLGTLQPQQERRIDVNVVPGAKGRCNCQATVSFSGAASTRFVVQEPKLVIKASAPERVLLGDMATMTLTVNNPGDGLADHVRVRASLSDGLEHVRGREIEFDLGNLGPNESRSLQVICAARAGGEQRLEATATAEGNLTAADGVAFEVVQPKLELSMTGPRLRYLDRQGAYILKVSNPGTAPASNVTIVNQIPQGFKFLEATAGGRHDYATRTVSWFLGDLPPNESREVTLTVQAVNIGEYKHSAVARAARGMQADAEAETRVEGLSALLVELVDVDDPVEVNAHARYEIRVTNTGTKTETNVQVVCVIPDKMDFWGAQGPGVRHRVEGKEVIFETLPKLAPRADAIFRIHCRALAAGDIRFRARIKSDSLSEPVNKEESTRVYGDDPAPPRE